MDDLIAQLSELKQRVERLEQENIINTSRIEELEREHVADIRATYEIANQLEKTIDEKIEQLMIQEQPKNDSYRQEIRL